MPKTQSMQNPQHTRTGAISPGHFLGVLLALAGPALAAPVGTEAPAIAAAWQDMDPNWEEELEDYLDLTVRWFDCGGPYYDPNDTPTLQLDDAWKCYEAAGIIPGLTTSQRTVARHDVEHVYHHVQLSPPYVDPVVKNQFLNSMQNMYADLGGNPSAL